MPRVLSASAGGPESLKHCEQVIMYVEQLALNHKKFREGAEMLENLSLDPAQDKLMDINRKLTIVRREVLEMQGVQMSLLDEMDEMERTFVKGVYGGNRHGADEGYQYAEATDGAAGNSGTQYDEEPAKGADEGYQYAEGADEGYQYAGGAYDGTEHGADEGYQYAEGTDGAADDSGTQYDDDPAEPTNV